MAQDITLLGASYSAVPAVTLPKTGGGSALFADPSPVTAVAADVAQGKYFINSNGDLEEGTGTGGSGVLPTTVILPEQTVTVSGENTLLSGNTEQLVIDGVYLLTVNGTSKITTAAEVYGSPSAIFIYYVRFEAGYGNQMYLSVYDSSLYGTYTVKVEKVLSLDYATLTTKAITTNGTYSAEDDNADGYSEVTVNVSGGVTPTGTKTINITGNGTTTEDVTDYASAQINVNVPSGAAKNVQTAQSTTRRNNTALGSITSLTCSKAGTYDVYWSCARSSTSGTWGSQLYINGVAYGTENTTFTNHVQVNHLSNVTIPANATVAVYGRSRSGYYIYAPQLSIVEA